MAGLAKCAREGGDRIKYSKQSTREMLLVCFSDLVLSSNVIPIMIVLRIVSKRTHDLDVSGINKNIQGW